MLHNGLHSSACSLDPDNEVSTLTDTIDVLITTGNIHATPRSPPTCPKILFISVYRWFSGVPKFGADRSAWGSCLFWGDSLGSIYISLGYFYSNSNSNWMPGR